jgi:hypothetical protein
MGRETGTNGITFGHGMAGAETRIQEEKNDKQVKEP